MDDFSLWWVRVGQRGNFVNYESAARAGWSAAMFNWTDRAAWVQLLEQKRKAAQAFLEYEQARDGITPRQADINWCRLRVLEIIAKDRLRMEEERDQAARRMAE